MSYGEIIDEMQSDQRYYRIGALHGRLNEAVGGLTTLANQLETEMPLDDPEYRVELAVLNAGVHRDRGFSYLRRALHPEFDMTGADMILANEDLIKAEHITSDLRIEVETQEPQTGWIRRVHGLNISHSARFSAARFLVPDIENADLHEIDADDVRTDFAVAHAELAASRVAASEGSTNAIKAALFERATDGEAMERVRWIARAGGFAIGLHGYQDSGELPRTVRSMLDGGLHLGSQRAAIAQMTNWRTV